MLENVDGGTDNGWMDARVTGILYSNKKETSDFHDTISFDPVKMSQQK